MAKKLIGIPWQFWACLVVFFVIVGGAGIAYQLDGRPPTRVPVSGQVLIDGKPLKYGYVHLLPEDERSSQGILDKEGRFVLTCYADADGAVAGKHRIEVAADEPLGETKVRWHAPKKYADYRTSGLTTDIKGPTDSLLIELSWDGGKPFVEDTETDQEHEDAEGAEASAQSNSESDR